jgi:hypothetical protein
MSGGRALCHVRNMQCSSAGVVRAPRALQCVPCAAPVPAPPQATKQLHSSPNDDGIGKGKCTDVNVFSQRMAAALLGPRPPMNYCDGYMWRVGYFLGCFAPSWLQLLIHKARYGL